MDIIQGLTDHQVLQRNRRNLSETHLIGQCNASGTLCLRATPAGSDKPLTGLAKKKIACLTPGRFKVTLTGIPAGGPYDLVLTLVSAQGEPLAEYHAKDILVGDVWILAGQSNMEGMGRLENAAQPDKNVRAFYMDDRWAVAKDRIHNITRAVDQVHWDLCNGKIERDDHTGVGPGVAFGQTMAELTGVPQGLLCCAHGGTTMTQWNPALKKLGGKSLYGATLRRFVKNGSNVAGVIWYQGCSDANETAAPLYTGRMKKLVAAFRRDLGNPQLPFAAVQIARVHRVVTSVAEERAWNAIQEQQRLLPKTIKDLTVVPAIDLALDDPIHISGQDQQLLGRRLAQAVWTLLKGKKALKPPIEIESVSTSRHPKSVQLIIEVAFRNVEGSLQAGGRPEGFTLCNSEDQKCDAIYGVDLKKNTAVIRTGLTPDLEDANFNLHYGFGLSPYCNITDSADRSLPVFGPWPIKLHSKPFAGMRKLRTSKLLPGAGKLETVACPDTADETLGWRNREFPTSFANIHCELVQKTDDALVFFAGKFKFDEPMKLQVGLGYDGPVKMWLDRNEIFHDPDGINPMIPDQAMIDLNAKPGEHEIVVAFSANFGQAWGIALRLHRSDLTQRQIQKGKDIKLPEILG